MPVAPITLITLVTQRRYNHKQRTTELNDKRTGLITPWNHNQIEGKKSDEYNLYSPITQIILTILKCL
jgi:hypothetical protein